ncbi:hypothetical protein NLU13_4717 [Sarocladium strictum]|uniref:Nudix hydrolase domain-containing protein n=1 Tax=Sarocladium strictum TaxID=5046 RepID=A0AA39L8Y4_SARSR|nr:hypothetical protein NLU13_4717 [Sarocladium strictum]
MGALSTDTPCPIPFHPSLKSYSLPPSEFLVSRPHIGRILSSNIVFHPSPGPTAPPLTLLLRRAPSDYWPLRWETPGGSLDVDTDPCILAAAVRELREETGLVAKRAVRCVAVEQEVEGYKTEDGGEVWTFPEPGTGWSWAKITFLMEVEGEGAGEVVLQDEEHVDSRWVTEEEVRKGKFRGDEGEKIDFVSEVVRLALLEAFRIKNEELAEEAAATYQQ